MKKTRLNFYTPIWEDALLFKSIIVKLIHLQINLGGLSWWESSVNDFLAIVGMQAMRIVLHTIIALGKGRETSPPGCSFTVLCNTVAVVFAANHKSVWHWMTLFNKGKQIRVLKPHWTRI